MRLNVTGRSHDYDYLDHPEVDGKLHAAGPYECLKRRRRDRQPLQDVRPQVVRDVLRRAAEQLDREVGYPVLHAVKALCTRMTSTHACSFR